MTIFFFPQAVSQVAWGKARHLSLESSKRQNYFQAQSLQVLPFSEIGRKWDKEKKYWGKEILRSKVPGSIHSQPSCGLSRAGRGCLRSLLSSTFDSSWKAWEKRCNQGLMFLGSWGNVSWEQYLWPFQKHLLTLNKSLELELDTDAKRVKSKKTNSP